jgi:hypothetical protein
MYIAHFYINQSDDCFIAFTIFENSNKELSDAIHFVLNVSIGLGMPFKMVKTFSFNKLTKEKTFISRLLIDKHFQLELDK